jgi:hypothetical protein
MPSVFVLYITTSLHECQAISQMRRCVQVESPGGGAGGLVPARPGAARSSWQADLQRQRVLGSFVVRAAKRA